MHPLTFGMSPCPNDTFAFHALAHRLVESPVHVHVVMDDIEALNQRARAGELDLTKLSVGALAGLGDRYVPLDSGAALGHGVGPLVVSREPMSLQRAAAGSLAIPGRDTTAYALLRLALGEEPQGVVELRYDEVPAAVARGDVDAGLIIHESRFTYADIGLVEIADLGEWWEAAMSMPVPLAVIGARSDLDAATRRAAEAAVRASVEYAFAHPEASAEFVREHAQEMSAAVCRQHIALYVNEHSVTLGHAGRAAVAALVAATSR